MMNFFGWSLPRGHSSYGNNDGIILLHVRKTNQIENLDLVIFQNRSEDMFLLATCKIVPIILLSSEILKVRSSVNDVRSCEGSS